MTTRYVCIGISKKYFWLLHIICLEFLVHFFPWQENSTTAPRIFQGFPLKRGVAFWMEENTNSPTIDFHPKTSRQATSDNEKTNHMAWAVGWPFAGSRMLLLMIVLLVPSLLITPPEFNMIPENDGFSNGTLLFQGVIFRLNHVKLQGEYQ